MHIRIYSTPACGYCRLAKEFLKSKNMEFEDVDVMADEKAAEEMIKLSGQMGVPVIVVTKDDSSQEILVGFQEEKLKQILKIN
ncbi:MAG: glutaredoxin domain-containing protein [Patescibacteria group bacterium]|nr:glutaredoxin domain-containing protein [Patescibacteria group bacterium]